MREKIYLWGSLAGIAGFIVGVITLIYEHSKVAVPLLVVSSILLILYTSYRALRLIHHSLLRYVPFQDSSMESFVDQIVCEDNVESLDVIAHTGEQLVVRLLNSIDGDDQLWNKFKQIPIRILVRNPNFEIGKRQLGISTALQKIFDHQNQGFTKLHVHFYQNLPCFRSIVCRRRKPANSRIAYLSFYHFPSIGKPSKAFPDDFIIDEGKTGYHSLIDVVESWFNHFWGKRPDSGQVHSIIFDFDDTIVNSHESQIQAWVDTIQKSRTSYELTPGSFTDEVSGVLDNDQELKERVATIFFQEQSSDRILRRIFKSELSEDLKRELDQLRFKIRKAKMRDVTFAANFAQILPALAKKYHLIIISATDEDMIESFLRTEKLLQYFWYVFGKKEPSLGWRTIERKSQLLHKIVNILGVPLEHLVYVGDNNSDYIAAKNIGVDFVEARLFQDTVSNATGRSSLISDENEEGRVFTNWNDFPKQLEDLEQEKRWRQVNFVRLYQKP